MHESLHILLDLVFPEGLKAYFELKAHKSDADNLHLYLEEINSIPEEFKGQKLESKGFLMRLRYRIFRYEAATYTFI
jgi:transposase